MENESVDDNSVEETVTIEKPKRKLNDKQKQAVQINLQKGRDALKLKKQQQKDESIKRVEIKKQMKDELIIKKANKIKKQADDFKKQLDLKDEDLEDEPVIIKPKKTKKIIYVQESDNDDEEEDEIVIIKKPTKQKKQIIEPPLPVQVEPVKPKFKFY